ncbi:uncharacterized protein C8Q71DRAFT_753664 [Rhodofomes roseus]|uniref:MYND-type domain-containing protein n=1 Tax=Rhodofomes roseus TaxID=34475 RepID=A0ABQ8KI10_9APHY|nr:uncharacterized protein C8Q71DRAFT_753664 [Rhodofomes roseus]KAH9837635.1 hypothetical protein C8Q71DRAFT_753664 [Rhodofomes roseus]
MRRDEGVRLFASDAERRADGSGGLKAHPRMFAILDRTSGYIKNDEGGQTLRDLYRAGTVGQDPNMYRRFALDCFSGQTTAVRQAVENGRAPDLTGTETPYKFGYCTLVIAGAQRGAAQCPGADHAATLKYLLNSGAPVDSCDIVGLTALHHATQNTYGPTVALARVLLENGADVNYQNRYGEVPIMAAFQIGDPRMVELLMEFGADLAKPDADGTTGQSMFVNTGPTVTAAVMKWMRKRTGEQLPLDGKSCAKCGKTNGALKICSKCHAVKYCSPECQRAHWREHKQTCTPFNAATSVTVRPSYSDLGMLLPTADVTRQSLGIPAAPHPSSHNRMSHKPHMKPGQPKAMVIKVQVPYTGRAPTMQDGLMLVYDKKRDFVCTLRPGDNREAYMRIAQTVWTKGVGGAKAYFPAELKSRDELVIKVGEVLAEQPF